MSSRDYRYSFWILRLGLAAVFLWFGIHKFFHPTYWINAWVPINVLSFISNLNISDIQFIYLNGIFEVVVGLGLITGVFMRILSVIAILFLVTVAIFFGFNEVIIRDIGLMAGLLAIVFWPQR